jgi:hypothetical protein
MKKWGHCSAVSRLESGPSTGKLGIMWRPLFLEKRVKAVGNGE